MGLGRRQFIQFVSATVCAGSFAAAQGGEAAAQVGGASFERRAQLAGADLVLNGIGMRAVAWFKAYAAGLYLTARASSAEQVVAAPGPKRIQLRMLRDLPASEFVKAFRQGMARSGSAELQAKLTARVDRFSEMVGAFGKLREGDVVNLDYVPSTGMSLSLNGNLRGDPIEGQDFYANLLRAFVGDQPYDEKLKAGLLGRSS